LYRNARVFAPTHPRAGAFAVEDGVITWIGDAASAARPAGVRVVDLGGALVTPAFVDAHVHVTATGLGLTAVDLRPAVTLAEALDLVERAARAGRGRPVLGGGWDESRWPERRPPTAAEQDRAAYGGAVYLARADIHSAVVSSALMAAVPGLPALAGYDPQGWQHEPDAHDAVRVAALAAMTAGQRQDAQRAALLQAASLGIACVHEMGGPVISSEDDLAALLSLAGSEPLPEVIGYWGELHGIDAARELGAVSAGGDLFVDGSLGSHTAALTYPYADRPETAGLLRYDTGDLVEHIVECADAGLQSGFHAIGDAAVDQLLDAYEQAATRLGRAAGPGQRIEHAEYVANPTRLAACGLTASMQPVFDELWGGRAGLYAERLGRDRALELNRFAALADAGVPLAFGSDTPVTEPGPWAAVRAACYPKRPGGGVRVEAAFAAHTAGGRRAAPVPVVRPGTKGPGTKEPRTEGPVPETGVLAPGAPATFAVWSTAAPSATGLPDLTPGRELPRCLATVRRGEPLYDTGVLVG
jgi:predicted amidohydrolase YtcJ